MACLGLDPGSAIVRSKMARLVLSPVVVGDLSLADTARERSPVERIGNHIRRENPKETMTLSVKGKSIRKHHGRDASLSNLDPGLGATWQGPPAGTSREGWAMPARRG